MFVFSKKKILLGTGSYDTVLKGNTVSVTGDKGKAWGYTGNAYPKLAPKLVTYIPYAEGLEELRKYSGDPLRFNEYMEKRRELEDEYIKSYYDIRLKDLDVNELLYTLKHKFGKEIILLCHEPVDQFCHRRLIADYIEMNTGIYIPEVAIGNDGVVRTLKPIDYKERLEKVIKG